MLHCQFTRRMFFCIVMGCDVSLLSPALFISKFVYVSLSVHGSKLIDSVHKLQLFEERGQPDYNFYKLKNTAYFDTCANCLLLLQIICILVFNVHAHRQCPVRT